MKKLYLLLCIILISSCGYNPVYKNITKDEFKITIQKMEGDKNINNLLRTQIKRYSNENSTKNFILNINSIYTKSTTSKDKTGRATDIQINLKTEFEILINNKNKKIHFEESINVENSTDSYAQRTYENEINNNFINSITNKLLIQLSDI